MAEKIQSILTGVSGEYFVAAELTRRGFITSITLRNTKGIDILASNSDAKKSIGIQVKTNYNDRKAWLLNRKAEGYFADNLFYVFVNLKGIGGLNFRPDYYIVPSRVVAEYVKTSHEKWLRDPGKRGQAHKDNPMRMFWEEKDQYKEKWDLFGMSTPNH